MPLILYSSPHALRRFFLRETGMTMSDWRCRHITPQDDEEASR